MVTRRTCHACHVFPPVYGGAATFGRAICRGGCSSMAKSRTTTTAIDSEDDDDGNRPPTVTPASTTSVPTTDNDNNDDIDTNDEAYHQLVGVHKPGSITRIQLENFLTYTHVDFSPGPRYVSIEWDGIGYIWDGVFRKSYLTQSHIHTIT